MPKSLLFLGKPATPGKVYGAPGAGRSGFISFMTAVALIALWFVVTRMGLIKPIFLPSPVAVYDKFIEAMTEGVANSTLAQHTGASLARVMGAFFLALVTAVPIGVLMGVNRIARGLFDPVIEFYRPLPPLAYLPLVIIWFGIGEFPKIFLIYLAIFAPMAIRHLQRSSISGSRAALPISVLPLASTAAISAVSVAPTETLENSIRPPRSPSLGALATALRRPSYAATPTAPVTTVVAAFASKPCHTMCPA